MNVLSLNISVIRICFGFRYSNFEFLLKILEYTTLKDLYERIRTKFSANYAKQTQFFGGRNIWKMFIHKGLQKNPPSGGIKNKPNSNPIQSQ